jgi:hypothetical protein
VVLFACELITAMGAPAAIFVAPWWNPPRGWFCVAESATGTTQNNLKCTKCCSLWCERLQLFHEFLVVNTVARWPNFQNSRVPKKLSMAGKNWRPLNSKTWQKVVEKRPENI